jgi:membrane protease YdiL (CAAX protease family)
MVVSNPAASQLTTQALLLTSSRRVLAALGVATLIWMPMIFFVQESRVFLLVMANQVGFLLVSPRLQRSQFNRRVMATGVLVMLAGVTFGVCYDAVLRLLFGAGTPTIGPWGEVRRMNAPAIGATLGMGVLIGPAADERFFRGGLFGVWQAAGRPWSGALLSSGLFALARLDPGNLPAYFGLGMLLCAAYSWTGSLLAVWVGHALLNAAMFTFLFCGYE